MTDETRNKGVVHTYGKLDRDYGMRMFTMAPEDDGPVFMVNYMKYKEVADYGADSDDKVSGREADDRYAPVDVLARIGAQVVFHGDVVDQRGNPDTRWDRIGVVCYATRKSFVEMDRRDDFKEKHVHKAAGMDRTFVIGCLPRAGVEPGDYRSDDKGRGIVAVGAHRTPDGSDPGAILAALGSARSHAVANGAVTGQWFDCEGTIMGDGRSFAVVTFDRYPDLDSWRTARAAMESDPACAVLFDPARCDHYNVAVEPALDRITRR